ARHDYPVLLRRCPGLLCYDLPFSGVADRGFFSCGHYDFLASSFFFSGALILTRLPSFSSRMAWLVPPTIFSLSVRPETTSKYFSPAIPTFTGLNVTLLSLPTMNTPSTSRFPTCLSDVCFASVTAPESFLASESSR